MGVVGRVRRSGFGLKLRVGSAVAENGKARAQPYRPSHSSPAPACSPLQLTFSLTAQIYHHFPRAPRDGHRLPARPTPPSRVVWSAARPPARRTRHSKLQPGRARPIMGKTKLTSSLDGRAGPILSGGRAGLGGLGRGRRQPGLPQRKGRGGRRDRGRLAAAGLAQERGEWLRPPTQGGSGKEHSDRAGRTLLGGDGVISQIGLDMKKCIRE